MNVERRKHRRVPLDLEATVALLFPEETFQPVALDARVRDISERGMMVRVTLPQSIYTSLLQKLRYCRVSLNEVGLPKRLVGKAVFISPEKQGDVVICRMGLFFEMLAPGDQAMLKNYCQEKLNTAVVS